MTEAGAYMPDLLYRGKRSEADVAAALDALPVAVVLTDLTQGHLLGANAAARALWGAAQARTLADWQERMRAETADPRVLPDLWALRHELAGSTPTESHLLLRDGRQVRWRTMAFGAGLAQEVHVFEADIVDPASPLPLPGAEELFRLTFEKAAVGMALISADLRFLRANASFCGILGRPEAELLECVLPALAHPEEGFDGRDLTRNLEAGVETQHSEVRLLHANGETIWVRLSLSAVRDAHGNLLYFIGLAEDVTEEKRRRDERERLTRELQVLVNRDPLTGLYNRRYMHDALAEQLVEASRGGYPVSVLMMDLDFFRDLNETHGHDAGDRALLSVSRSLRAALRDTDLACRYGGDELIAILVGAPVETALSVAERIQTRVAEARPVASLHRPLTCSLGVATFPDHASTVASLLKAADMALYQAKRRGKNRIAAYTPRASADSLPRLESLRSTLQGASLEAINALVTAIDLRDRFTGAHCQRVGRLAVELGARLGCSEEDLDILRLGGPLLDVGKIGLPDYLLTKTGSLTGQEWELMRQHPVWGEELVRRSALPTEVLELVRWHHERLDGSGYPDGLVGGHVPRLVRIISVADVATALREDRPHRRAWPRERVQDYLRRHAGEKLDGEVVDAYCDLGVR
jgi:diguanylate cyclase (GGDEF)-like protein/PAS domain S-box-containing protein